MSKKVVFFGRRFEANMWANQNKRAYKDVILGTETAKLQVLDHYPDVVIDDTWKPTETDKTKALLSLDVLGLLKIIHEELAA